MSFKIAFIGAGSVGFTRKLVADILTVPEFSDVSIVLMDIDRRNLEMIHQLLKKDLLENSMPGITLSTTVSQKEAVAGARYIINCARVGGLKAFAKDVDIPLKYGVDQCVGDTLCAGGIFYGQRGIPMILSLCRDIRNGCEPVDSTDKTDRIEKPEYPVLLNYANPNAMLTWAANTYGQVNTIGLCHGVQAGHLLIADALGIPSDELEYDCVGINHQTWYTRLEHQGRPIGRHELLDSLEQNEFYAETEKVRIDVLRRFGLFSTESNGHLSEYLSWYRKRPGETSDWTTLRDSWIHGETGGYLRVCNEKRNWFETDFPQWLEEKSPKFTEENRSLEHGSRIIEAMETGRSYRGHFNVHNGKTIPNLPEDAVIESPGVVLLGGLDMTQMAPLPPGPAAVCSASIGVQRLSVLAAVSGDINLLEQALLMDPLTAAVCTPPEIRQLRDEMLIAENEWLPQYASEIPKAEKRLALNPPDHALAIAGMRREVRKVEELRNTSSGVDVETQAFGLDGLDHDE